MVAVVVVIVDVDDEEGEAGGEDAQKRISNISTISILYACILFSTFRFSWAPDQSRAKALNTDCSRFYAK